MADTPHNQINLNYDEEQDRVLLKISDQKQEYRLWFTRRLAIRLNDLFLEKEMPNTHTTSHLKPAQKQTLGSIEKEAAVSKADFSTPFSAEETVDFPLGEEGVLVHKIDIKIKGKVVHMSMHPKEGKGATLSLPPSQRYSFEHIFQKVMVKAEWIEGDKVSAPARKEITH